MSILHQTSPAISSHTPGVEDILSRLDNVRRSGNGWTARCPAHDDRHNSLKVSPGDDGRLLVHCFAGCPPERIVAALGLTMAALFEHRNTRGEGVPISPQGRHQPCNRRNPMMGAPWHSTQRKSSYR
jgi:hypothetical protein